jgi:hypothetical protein
MNGFSDSRLSPQNRERKDVAGPRGARMYRAFCVSCGADGGLVSQDMALFIYLCNGCAEKYGGLPLPEVSEEFMRTGVF